MIDDRIDYNWDILLEFLNNTQHNIFVVDKQMVWLL